VYVFLSKALKIGNTNQNQQQMTRTSFLKLCYFLAALLTVGCGEGPSGKPAAPGSDPDTQPPAQTTPEARATILFFGNSLTAGLGVEPEQAFPGQIGKKLDSLGYPYTVINAGLSGETTASGVNRLDWVLRQPVDIFVLELGANDGLRGIPLSETRKNLETIIRNVREANPQVQILLTGMQLPPNMGPDYTAEFREIFPDLAQRHDLLLVPFLLEGVGGVPELNQADGIHPTPQGHKILAENVWQVLQPALRRDLGS